MRRGMSRSLEIAGEGRAFDARRFVLSSDPIAIEEHPNVSTYRAFCSGCARANQRAEPFREASGQERVEFEDVRTRKCAVVIAVA
jgi:hypothetical protein